MVFVFYVLNQINIFIKPLKNITSYLANVVSKANIVNAKAVSHADSCVVKVLSQNA